MVNAVALKIYQQLPPLGRHLLATIHGYTLARQRYPADAEDRVAEILERDHWSAQRWQHFQQERTAFILHRAATRVPYYRDQWQKRRKAGEHCSWEHLENWPLLDKETIRKFAADLIADDVNPKTLLTDTTGGSTGTPLRVWFGREVQYTNYALFEARVRRWNGLDRFSPWGTMGGQQIVPTATTHPPFWTYNLALHQIYLSTNHLGPQNISAYCDALRRHHTTHIIAYTSAITYLANQAIALGLPLLEHLKTVITNSEGLFPWQRQQITQAFGCNLRETYGMVELTASAAERDGSLRVFPEVGVIETFQDHYPEPTELGIAGRFICTGLLNAEMPLIRYDVGDRGIIDVAPTNTASFAYPVIRQLEGRVTDMLITRDGKRVWYFNPIFSGLPLQEAQIIQDSLSAVRILLVPDTGFTAETQSTIQQRLITRLGEVNLSIHLVERIPTGKNGKFRLVMCNVPAEELRRIDQVKTPMYSPSSKI